MVQRGIFKNRVLRLEGYKDLAGNERERMLASLPLPGIDFVEWKSPEGKRDFNPSDYRALYEHCFPNPDEQSPWSEMKGTISDMARIDKAVKGSAKLQKKYKALRYHDVVVLSEKDVIGFTSFATIPLDSENTVVYGLYAGVADPAFMKKQYGGGRYLIGNDIISRLYVLAHGLAQEDAMKRVYAKNVAGTFMESEFIGQANDEQGIRETKARLRMHSSHGALTMMLDTGNGLITPCVQPALSDDSNPLLMHLLFRERMINPDRLDRITEIDLRTAMNLMRSHAYSYEWQSTESEIVQMHRTIDQRIGAAKRAILVPPRELPNIVELARMDPMLMAQVERDYGSIAEHSQRIKSALG